MPAEPSTPIRRQYLDIKRRYPHAIVFFRLGDFYETFDDDAKLVARELEITLTSKPMGKGLRVPLAGVPYHSARGAPREAGRRGYKVAICEQMEDPARPKGIVEREVVRVVTPGTVVEEEPAPPAANNYLVAVAPRRPSARTRRRAATASPTSMSRPASSSPPQARAPTWRAELARLGPAEVLLPEGADLPAWLAGPRHAARPRAGSTPMTPSALLREHFGVASLEGFGLRGLPAARQRRPARSLAYLRENQRAALAQRHATCASTTRRASWSSTPRRGATSSSSPPRRDGGSARLAARRARLTRRRWARGCCAAGSASRCSTSPRSTRGSTASQHFFDDALRRAPACATACATCRTSSASSDRIVAGAAAPRDLVALRRGLEALPGGVLRSRPRHDVRARRRRRRAASEALALLAAAIADDPAPRSTTAASCAPASRRSSTRRARSPATCVAPSPSSKPASASAPASARLRVGLQPRLRLLHRGQQRATRARAGRLPAQADAGRRRALRHAASSRSTRSASSHAREAIGELEASLFRQRLRPARARGASALQRGRAAIAELDVVQRAWPRSRRATATCGPRSTTATRIEIRDGRHPVVERSARRRPLRAQRRRRSTRRRADRRAHRPEHGRQVDLPAPGGADRAAGADRQLRARRSGAHRRRRPHLHAHRRPGRPQPRRVDLHGRDGRDGGHPAPRHAGARS